MPPMGQTNYLDEKCGTRALPVLKWLWGGGVSSPGNRNDGGAACVRPESTSNQQLPYPNDQSLKKRESPPPRGLPPWSDDPLEGPLITTASPSTLIVTLIVTRNRRP